MNQNNKEKFELWLSNNMTENSGANSSYLRSLSLLEESYYKEGKIKTKSIFDVNDVSKIKELYKEAIEIQRDKNSYIYRKEAPSYGDKGFFSASLKKYIDFLSDGSSLIKIRPDVKHYSFDFKTFHHFSKESSLNFSKILVLRFIASLTSKPFVILSGLSGSGKTKIAQSFVQWICESDNQYKIVPVGADWTNREPLVGYPNGLVAEEYITPDSGVLNLLIKANNDLSKPYFLILDEMNLSHVERYFADFLSIMESNDTIKLYSGKRRQSLDGLLVPFEIGWPKNVFIIGTVNIDETTYMFSPKVLDRANVIEFRITEDEIENFLGNPAVPDLSKLSYQGANMAESFLSIAKQNDIQINEDIANELVSFFNQLKPVGAEFGYRSASEIMQLAAKLKINPIDIGSTDGG
jgi:5-methylcytosine-specific restriction protein B